MLHLLYELMHVLLVIEWLICIAQLLSDLEIVLDLKKAINNLRMSGMWKWLA
jgi:hypothetical protein